MSKVNLFLAIIIIGLQGCIIADDMFLPTPPEKEKSLQEQSQDAVEWHIAKRTKEFKYSPYGFSEIIIKKPVEIVELEKLQKEQEQNPEKDLDSLIAEKKAFIREHNIERSIEIDHFYTLEDSLGTITIIEDKFILNDTLGVRSSELLLMTEILEEYEDVLIYYFYEYTIFLSYSYEASRKLSLEFYSFFKARLEELETISERSEFLWHTIQLCKYVKDTGEFHQQYVLEQLVQKFIKEKRNDIKDYEPLEFSSLLQTTDESDETVINYYFFHKFIGMYGTILDTNVVMVEFTPYYEIGPIYQMDRPFDQYFE